MADRIAFSLLDDVGVPLTSATPAFVDYKTRTQSNLPQPTITHLGGGVYGFSPTNDDEVTGVVFLIDNGVGSNPRRFSGSIHKSAAPFFVWHIEDGSDNLYAGVSAPVFGLYDDFNGDPKTPPVMIEVTSPYLWAFTPSIDDLVSDVAFRVDNPAGSYPEFVSGSVEMSGPAAPSSSLTLVEAIRSELLLDSDVTTLVAARIHPLKSPQPSPTPYVILTEISNVPENAFMGVVATRARMSRLQVDVYSTTYKEAHSVARAVEAVIGDLTRLDLSTVRDNLQDIYEDVSQLYRVSLDFIVWR